MIVDPKEAERERIPAGGCQVENPAPSLGEKRLAGRLEGGPLSAVLLGRREADALKSLGGREIGDTGNVDLEAPDVARELTHRWYPALASARYHSAQAVSSLSAR